MSELAVGIATGTLASLVASSLFLWCMLSLRPRIEISPQICRAVQSDGKLFYSIKMLNKTRVSLTNVQMELCVATLEKMSGGIIVDATPVAIKRSNIMILGKFNRRDEDAKYAFRAICYEDLRGACGSSQYLTFTVYATHSLSGFGKVFRKHYHHSDSEIVDGDFAFGNTLAVVPIRR